jgi:hypothetical protein
MSRTGWGIVALLYIAIIAAALGRLHWARGSLLEKLDTEAARQNWEAWRDEARQQAAGKGPVRRQSSKSPEPPTLVLLRDYYGMCLAGVWLFTTLLFVVLVFVGRGLAMDLRVKPGGSPAPSGRGR